MMRRSLATRLPFAPGAWLAMLVLSAASAVAAPPNILLIFADDIGYEALGCYGGQDFATLRLDTMARQGLRFARAYTSPVCTPSRVSLHTSLHTTAHRFTTVLPVHMGTKKKVDFTVMTTFAQLMRARGYATSITGKWQLATLEAHPNHIATAGFDSWCVWQIWRAGAKTTRYWRPAFNHDGALRTDIAERFGPDVLVDYVIDRMTAARDAGTPFLIVHNELLPHEPIVRTPDDVAAGRAGSLGGMITYMDQLVGRLLDAVEGLGIRDNTYVFFMGDNGTEARHFPTRHTRAGPVTGGKRDLTDAGTHVALLGWGPPGLPVGRTCRDLVDVTDLFPTFCGLSGTPIPASVPYAGRSLVPQLQGRSGQPRHWTHQGVNRNETLFDGAWRLSRSGKLTDARSLPAERAALPMDMEAAAARTRLQPVFDALHTERADPVSGGLVIDNTNAALVTVVGDWKVSSAAGGCWGPDYLHDLNTGKGAKSVTFAVPVATGGTHRVYLRWTAQGNRATNVPVTVRDAGGTHAYTIDQTRRGGAWNLLDAFTFETGGPAEVRIGTTNTAGYVIADAVRVVPSER